MANEPGSKDTQASESESDLKTLLAQTPRRDKNESGVDIPIGVSSIDVALLDLLKLYLTQTVHDSDELLNEGRPLVSLMLSAKLACRLGLMSTDTYAVIKDLSRIRNNSAHSNQRFDVFDKDDVKQSIRNIWNRIDNEFKAPSDNAIERQFNAICNLMKLSIFVQTQDIMPISSREKEVIFI